MTRRRRRRRSSGAKRERIELRRAQHARTDFPDELPISERVGAIQAAIERAPVVIVAGETGSGKTTQLPKICLAIGRGIDGMIGHTQPRRLAAHSVARRIAAETGLAFGKGVGVQVRFDARIDSSSRLKLMTDGILLNEIAHDRSLRAYDTLIIDEAHERSLNIDFLLGYLNRLIRKRQDLKVIVTSATINTGRFAAFFDDAPVVEVSGRGFPVEIRYAPPVDDCGLPEAVAREALHIAEGLADGDVLVFLPGEREIHDTRRHLEKALRRSRLRDWEVASVFGRLPDADQRRLFEPGHKRRIVLATNIAETSITVPRIHAVLDSGLARISRYSVGSRIQRLVTEPVSQASAAQRAGRCGRIAPGVCTRLYAEEDFDARPAYTDPEILRTNLASVLLRMHDAGLGAIEDFPLIDPPESRAVTDGRRLLRRARCGRRSGPTDENGTPHGAVTRRPAARPRAVRGGRAWLPGRRDHRRCSAGRRRPEGKAAGSRRGG